MRRQWSVPRFYPPSMIIFCFFIGILGGTIWVGMMAGSMREQFAVFSRAKMLEGVLSLDADAFFRVWIQREMEAGFLWLIGMTAFAVPGFLLASFYGGFSMSVIISLMTIQDGLMGLPMYLLSVFPQILLYIPVFLILFFWGLNLERKPHLAGFLVLTILITLGAFAETFLNPYVMGVLKYFISIPVLKVS